MLVGLGLCERRLGLGARLLLVLGFPIAIFFAWMRELPLDAAAPVQARITDWALISVLAAVLLVVSYQQLMSSRSTVTVQPWLKGLPIAMTQSPAAI